MIASVRIYGPDGEMGEPVGIYAAFNELDEAKFCGRLKIPKLGR